LISELQASVSAPGGNWPVTAFIGSTLGNTAASLPRPQPNPSLPAQRAVAATCYID
jgi:hypothetical protein